MRVDNNTNVAYDDQGNIIPGEYMTRNGTIYTRDTGEWIPRPGPGIDPPNPLPPAPTRLTGTKMMDGVEFRFNQGVGSYKKDSFVGHIQNAVFFGSLDKILYRGEEEEDKDMRPFVGSDVYTHIVSTPVEKRTYEGPDVSHLTRPIPLKRTFLDTYGFYIVIGLFAGTSLYIAHKSGLDKYALANLRKLQAALKKREKLEESVEEYQENEEKIEALEEVIAD